MPKMVGVVWGDFKSIGNVETYVAACAHCTVSRLQCCALTGLWLACECCMWQQWLYGRVHSELVWRAWWVSWCCGGVQHGHGDGCVHLVECDVVGVCDDDDVQECAVELGQPYDGCGFVGWVICGDCVLPLLRVSDLWYMLWSLCGCVCWMRTLRSTRVRMVVCVFACGYCVGA